VLQPPNLQTDSGQNNPTPRSIQLLLFVDDRPSSQEQIGRIQAYLQNLKAESVVEATQADGTATRQSILDWQTIEIGEQPHLVEHFKLIATPALVKILPEPRQTLAGSNIIEQLQRCFPRWIASLQEQGINNAEPQNNSNGSSSAKVEDVGYADELIRLSDEVFRLKQEREEFLEQLKFKDQVLAMLAHDLRSPLTAASIAVETLELAESRVDEERAQKLKQQLYLQARKQFRIMDRIITEILQASKSMSAELRADRSRIRLSELCEETIAQFSEQFKSKSQRLETDIPQDLPFVYADAELIRQVLVNLLDNAYKYTPEGGTISVSILHRTTQKIQLSVCDTGPGIPEEKRERIFEGHFRLKRDESKEGYGLGLSMCRKIVRVHYGQIWVDSVLDGGSCFRFTLPVYR
jgi:two-component system, OmpR family, clock-associated histidine kinase SasA